MYFIMCKFLTFPINTDARQFISAKKKKINDLSCMSKVVRKPPKEQTYKEKCINLIAARKARKRKAPKPRKKYISKLPPKKRLRRQEIELEPWSTFFEKLADFVQSTKRQKEKPPPKRKRKRSRYTYEPIYYRE